MKNIPIFATCNGVASLTLEQIPYRSEAYVRIRASENAREFIQECGSFCRAAGADRVYATGHPMLETYRFYTAIYRMRRTLTGGERSESQLRRVCASDIEQWRKLYNSKMADVPNAAWLTIAAAQELLASGDAYFVEQNGETIGIGQASGEQIKSLAALAAHMGGAVLDALLTQLRGRQAVLEVASANVRAMRLYEAHGFRVEAELSRWYHI